jgi:hypothetical protein
MKIFPYSIQHVPQVGVWTHSTKNLLPQNLTAEASNFETQQISKLNVGTLHYFRIAIHCWVITLYYCWKMG